METKLKKTRERIDDLIRRHKVHTDFPAEVLDAAAAFGNGLDDPTLEDLTHLPFVTIDNPDSRDLDQALYIEQGSNGGFRVWYALADASFFAPPGGAILNEALRRGATQYFPSFAHPMLPRRLSEDLVSLNPDVDRRALVFRLDLNNDGVCTETTMLRGRVRSRAKLNYRQVQRFLDNGGSAEPALDKAPYSVSLRLLRDVGQLRLHDAAQRDVVRYDRREVYVQPDKDSLRLRERARYPVETWNAQISLLCNVEGAAYLAQAIDPELAIEGVFRVHPPPTREDVASFAAWIDRLVAAFDLDPAAWRWRRDGPDSLADYIERLPDDGEWVRLAMAIQRQAMLLNQKAEFSVQPGAHHGIGAPYYSRFSSPMREVVGIVTHQLALDQQHEARSGLTRAMVDDAVRIGNEAKDLQKRLTRAVIKLAIDDLMEADLAAPKAPTRRGTVMGMTANRLHVRLDDPPVDLKLYFDLVAKHAGIDLVPDDNGLFLRSKSDRSIVARLGADIDVRVIAYEPDLERWAVAPVLDAAQ